MTPEDELVGGDIIHPVLHLVGGRPVVGIELIDTLGNESGVEEIPEHEGPEASQHDDYCAHETPPTFYYVSLRVRGGVSGGSATRPNFVGV